MRRWLSSLLVALLLLVQQGAVLHGLAHAMAAAQAPSVQAGGASAEPAEHPCGECQAFAQLASAHTAPSAQAILLPGLAHARPAHDSPAGLAAQTPPPRSRGPPNLA
jgi:hypothetical protein